MTLEMPEIDSKGQSVHLCKICSMPFISRCYYSVDACPPQRTYVYVTLSFQKVEISSSLY